MVRICKGPSGLSLSDFSDFSDLPTLDTLFSGKGPKKRKKRKRERGESEKVQQSIEIPTLHKKPFIPKRVDL